MASNINVWCKTCLSLRWHHRGYKMVRLFPQEHFQRYSTNNADPKDEKLKKAKTPIGRLDEKWNVKDERMEPQKDIDPYAPFPGDKNPDTGEIGGPKGPEPTRYGDWERKGRVIDF